MAQSALRIPPVSGPLPTAGAGASTSSDARLHALELPDGTVYTGYAFGAERSTAGELVFQTGMVGYPESLTDPSYRGQILVITFPMVGNYGVPDRNAMDELLVDLPAHFESEEVHIAGLVIASYCGENFSHFLAKSSLGTWLKEQNVPAMYGVDTRALTKTIRTQGSMLGRMLLQKSSEDASKVVLDIEDPSKDWKQAFDVIDFYDPNKQNLVAEGTKKIYSPTIFSFFFLHIISEDANISHVQFQQSLPVSSNPRMLVFIPLVAPSAS